jgi:nicotinate (nicotinamide) nucleotide adenylyltransferase
LVCRVCKRKFQLGKVFFIPNKLPPHREIPEATSKQRYEMVMLAILNNPYFEVLPIELERKGFSYTVDTLRDLSSLFHNTEIYLLLGQDAFKYFLTWKDPFDILKLSKIVVGNRGENYFSEEINRLVEKFEDRIFFLEFPYFPISAREIRDRIKKGLSIKYLVPELVESYIIKNRIYVKEEK